MKGFWLGFGAALLLGATGCANTDDAVWSGGGGGGNVGTMAYGAGYADDGSLKAQPPTGLTLPESPADREMAYAVSLKFNTRDVAAALTKAEELGRALGGYATSIDDDSIELKIPASKLNDALKSFETLGVLASRSVTARDVTEEIVDVRVRLENLQKLQLKLQKLLENAGKVSELLEVERELARVTTEIERFEAKKKNLALSVNYARVTIRFTALDDPALNRNLVVVPWVAGLGEEIWNSELPANRCTRKPFSCELPAGFVTVAAGSDDGERVLYAINAEEVVLKLSRLPNLDGATNAFYLPQLPRALKSRNFTLNPPEVKKNADGVVFDSVKADCSQGETAWTYQVIFTVSEGNFFFGGKVFLIECWGPAAAVEKVDFPKFLDSISL